MEITTVKKNRKNTAAAVAFINVHVQSYAVRGHLTECKTSVVCTLYFTCSR